MTETDADLDADWSDYASNPDDGRTIIKLIEELKVSQARIAELESALRAIEDTPTTDSGGMINNANNWTKWAKERARRALEETK